MKRIKGVLALHIIEFVTNPGHIWACQVMARRLRMSPWRGMECAWLGQVGYDREPFTGPRWDRWRERSAGIAG